MKNIPKEKINLIYLDPPFFSNRTHEVSTPCGKRTTFEDVWKNGINEYLDFMKKILGESLRILDKKGSLFLHCDWHASHYLKIEMDKIFGYHNFRNEIIWKRHNSQNNSKQGSKIFGRIHDVILVYSKNHEYFWEQPYEEYSQEYLNRTYNHIDEKTGERYALGDLSGPGGASKGNPYFEFLGFKRYWRYNKSKVEKLFKEEKIVQTKSGTIPKLKRFLKDVNGIPLSDVWINIGNEQTTNRKNICYPTQKPTKLLDRIIKCSTKRGDIVLDPFCGSGTTLLCAQNLERKWIGIDNSPSAINVTIQRLQQAGVLKNDFLIHYEKLCLLK